MSITSVAFVRANAGHEPKLGGLLAELAQHTRREPGCMDYSVLQSLDTPSLWFIYSKWRSDSDVLAHLRAEHVKRFAQESQSVIDGELSIGLFAPPKRRSS